MTKCENQIPNIDHITSFTTQKDSCFIASIWNCSEAKESSWNWPFDPTYILVMWIRDVHTKLEQITGLIRFYVEISYKFSFNCNLKLIFIGSYRWWGSSKLGEVWKPRWTWSHELWYSSAQLDRREGEQCVGAWTICSRFYGCYAYCCKF